MIKAFQELNEEEVRMMQRVPVWVSVLIAGADDNIDTKEIEKAIFTVRFKQYRSRKALRQYYRSVNDTFQSDLIDHIKILPKDAKTRNDKIIQELSKVRVILPKLEKGFREQFVASMQDFAKKIAKASGGVFGYMSIGYEESKFLDLKVLQGVA